MTTKLLSCAMSSRIWPAAVRIWNDESGQDLIEYALVAALVGLGAIASMKTLGTKVGTAFNGIGTTLTTNT
jgi:pilus assembly protein Flp/PilA